MATATQQTEPQQAIRTKEESEFQKLLRQGVSYRPYGESGEIELTPRTVFQYLATPTRAGKMPSEEDCTRFIMLCKARELNPWAGDAFMLGYDTQDGPKFECITAVSALLKRAEANPKFDGLQMGVILQGSDGEKIEREGDFVGSDETLLGGWCKAYRKDRSFPYYSALKLGTYNQNHGRWKKDAPGMIVKCAKAASLRNAFPTQLGGLYLREEVDHAYEPRQYTDASGEARSGKQFSSRADRIASQVSNNEIRNASANAPGGEIDTSQDPEAAKDAPVNDDASQDGPATDGLSPADEKTLAAFVKRAPKMDAETYAFEFDGLPEHLKPLAREAVVGKEA